MKLEYFIKIHFIEKILLLLVVVLEYFFHHCYNLTKLTHLGLQTHNYIFGCSNESFDLGGFGLKQTTTPDEQHFSGTEMMALLLQTYTIFTSYMCQYCNQLAAVVSSRESLCLTRSDV